FFSISNPHSFEDVENAVNEAAKTAQHYGEKNKTKVNLANISTNQQKIDYPVLNDPSLDELVKIGFDCDKIIQSQKRIIKAVTSLGFAITSKYFVSSEGSKISQNITDVVVDLVATAHESGLTQSVNITEGGRGGMEKITKEIDILEKAKFVSEKASQLIDAKPAKESKSTVVLNPDFVSLLTHEILG
ncbi:MAG: TldD/PmbA family protein, partial [Nitrosopumilus sp.]